MAERTKAAKGKRRGRWIEIAAVAALFLVTGLLLVTGRTEVFLSRTSVTLKGTYWPSKEIPLTKIQAVEYREEFTKGKRVGGFGSFTLSMGSFRNEEFGNYTLYGNNRCNAYVIMETDDGMVAVNGRNQEETRELYERIKDVVSQTEG